MVELEDTWCLKPLLTSHYDCVCVCACACVRVCMCVRVLACAAPELWGADAGHEDPVGPAQFSAETAGSELLELPGYTKHPDTHTHSPSPPAVHTKRRIASSTRALSEQCSSKRASTGKKKQEDNRVLFLTGPPCVLYFQNPRTQDSCISVSAGYWSVLSGSWASRTSCDFGRYICHPQTEPPLLASTPHPWAINRLSLWF